MRFIVDAQLPPALARWLVQEGHEAEHVADRLLATAPDTVIVWFEKMLPEILAALNRGETLIEVV